MTDNINKDSVQPEPARSVPVDAEAVVTPEAITPDAPVALTAAEAPVTPAVQTPVADVPAAPAEAAVAAPAPAAAPAPVAPPVAPAAAAPAVPQQPSAAPYGAAAPNATVYAPNTPPQPYASQQAPTAQLPYGQHPSQQHPAQPYGAQHTQPTVPIPGAAFGVGGPGGPGGPAAPAQPAASAAPKRNGVGMLVAALAIGALVGGGSAAGVMAIAGAQNQGTPSSSVSSPQNVVVNNTDSVTEITAVAAKATPSVVTISVAGETGAGTGSGVVLSEDGYVLTNTHVVTLDGETGHPQIQVTMSDGTLYAASIVGTDPISDLAVIKLENASGLTALKFADSSKINVGDTAIAIGAPLGLSGTVTNGIVSALNRSITVASSAVPETPQGDSTTPDGGSGQAPFDFWNNLPGQQQQAPSANSGSISLAVVQTDAAINPGNSGGALLNSQGELIGINVAIATAGDSSASGSIGVGFAIPSNVAERVSTELIENGTATHGLLGATVSPAASVEGSTTVGAYIADVTAGGPAASAGLQKGDVITRFNGVPITDANDLTAQVRTVKGGGDASLTYVRDGKSYDVDVTLGTLGS
ncbi:putative serine protease PepD [Microterricola gilva]|uniref:Putative serine protease PepD n=1 Tax=Microterricola gilva TaxID=393267 RepID=A0A4Q8AJ92_9MICO|nr:trypsin-like peptidase domain-containing protein [Microterricola gilva]RZU64552.1 putative serine protease PepD [Microterricola gilva]